MVNLPPVRSATWADTYSAPSVKARRLPQSDIFQLTSGPSTIWAAAGARPPVVVAPTANRDAAATVRIVFRIVSSSRSFVMKAKRLPRRAATVESGDFAARAVRARH